MKYKVGDKVRVRKDLEDGKVYGKEIEECFVDTMINYKGKILTIESIDHNGYWTEETNYHWVDEMFEDKVNNKVIFNKNATILIKDGKKYVSKCHGEEFDKEKGLLMCLAKANGISYMDLQEMLNNAVGENKDIVEVKRKAKIGEYVKVIDKRYGHFFKIGEIVKCYKIDPDKSQRFECLDRHDYWYMSPEEYVVLENYKPKNKNKYKITLKEFWNSKEKLAIHCEKKEDLKKLFDTMKEKGFYVKGKEDNFCKNIPYIENNKNMDCVNILQTVLVAGYKVYEFEDVGLEC